MLFLLGVSPMAKGSDQKVALEAFRNGDYSTALQEWELLAVQGSVPAQYNLGRMYLLGLGVSKDAAEAIKWLTRAEDRAVSLLAVTTVVAPQNNRSY